MSTVVVPEMVVEHCELLTQNSVVLNQNTARKQGHMGDTIHKSVQLPIWAEPEKDMSCAHACDVRDTERKLQWLISYSVSARLPNTTGIRRWNLVQLRCFSHQCACPSNQINFK